MMAREFGVIARLQTAEAICHHPHVTLGFDATTQEGVHINSLHVTTESSCYVVSVDELPGGTAVDHSEHICESIDNLAKLYRLYTETNYQRCRSKLVSNISNCMTDRAAANHAVTLAIRGWTPRLVYASCTMAGLRGLPCVDGLRGRCSVAGSVRSRQRTWLPSGHRTRHLGRRRL